MTYLPAPGSRTDQAWAHRPNLDAPMGDLDTAAHLVRLNAALALLGHAHVPDLDPVLAADEKPPAYLTALDAVMAESLGRGLTWVERPKPHIMLVKYADSDDQGVPRLVHQVGAFVGGVMFPAVVDSDEESKIPSSPLGVALVILCRFVDMVPTGRFEEGAALLEGLVPDHDLEFWRMAYEHTLGYTMRAGDAGASWMTDPTPRE